MPRPNGAVAVRHPHSPAMVTLNPARDYPADDPLVKAYPWAFEANPDAGKRVESVSVEQATAAPGEKRSRARAKK